MERDVKFSSNMLVKLEPHIEIKHEHINDTKEMNNVERKLTEEKSCESVNKVNLKSEFINMSQSKEKTLFVSNGLKNLKHDHDQATQHKVSDNQVINFAKNEVKHEEKRNNTWPHNLQLINNSKFYSHKSFKHKTTQFEFAKNKPTRKKKIYKFYGEKVQVECDNVRLTSLPSVQFQQLKKPINKKNKEAIFLKRNKVNVYTTRSRSSNL